MITEDYVSFETAKLLKEKGFDEHCFCINYPLPEGGHYNIILPNLLNNSMIPFTDEYKFCRYKEDFITIPTLQMAMKWLRKNHQIFIRPNTSFLYPIRWYSEIFCYGDNLKTQQDVKTEYYDSPEEACEAAIRYCLENLINKKESNH